MVVTLGAWFGGGEGGERASAKWNSPYLVPVCTLPPAAGHHPGTPDTSWPSMYC